MHDPLLDSAVPPWPWPLPTDVGRFVRALRARCPRPARSTPTSFVGRRLPSWRSSPAGPRAGTVSSRWSARAAPARPASPSPSPGRWQAQAAAGGVWLVSLAAADALDRRLDDGGRVPVSPRPDEALEVTLVGHLRTAWGLVVLDNCEHVAAVVAATAAAIIDACPDLQLVVTSRVGLDTGIGRRLGLGPMSADDAVSSSLARAAGSDGLAGSDGDGVDRLLARLDRLRWPSSCGGELSTMSAGELDDAVATSRAVLRAGEGMAARHGDWPPPSPGRTRSWTTRPGRCSTRCASSRVLRRRRRGRRRRRRRGHGGARPAPARVGVDGPGPVRCTDEVRAPRDHALVRARAGRRAFRRPRPAPRRPLRCARLPGVRRPARR